MQKAGPFGPAFRLLQKQACGAVRPGKPQINTESKFKLQMRHNHSARNGRALECAVSAGCRRYGVNDLAEIAQSHIAHREVEVRMVQNVVEIRSDHQAGSLPHSDVLLYRQIEI